MSESLPIYSFTSHIAGKNAHVYIFPDRIEWEKKGLNDIARHSLAFMTVGISYAKTGIIRSNATEVIPMRSISSLTTKKGIMNTMVKIITAGNSIEINVSHDEAKKVKNIVNSILAGNGIPSAPTQPQQTAPSLEATSNIDLNQLIQWHRDGILSDEEFAAAKRAALGI